MRHQTIPSTLLLTGLLAMPMTGCMTGSASPQEKRLAIQDMASDTLEDFYDERPSLEPSVDRAEGFAVFSNVGVQALLVSGGGGYGIVHNNETGEDTYMRMGQGGVGLGLGIKDFRALMVFHTDEALQDFITRGEWNVGADADAAVVSGDKGAEASGAAVADAGVSIYQLTKTGLVLGANVSGTRYWRIASLN